MIDWARSRGIGVEAQAVLTRAFPQPVRVLESLLELGVHSATIKPVRPGFSESFTPADLPALRDAYDEYFERVDGALRDGDMRFFEAVKHDYPLRPLWKFVLRTRAEGRCFWGSSHLVVDAGGRYWPCDSVVGREQFLCGTVDSRHRLGRLPPRRVLARTRRVPVLLGAGLMRGHLLRERPDARGGSPRDRPFRVRAVALLFGKCLELAANVSGSGVDPHALGPILLRY